MKKHVSKTLTYFFLELPKNGSWEHNSKEGGGRSLNKRRKRRDLEKAKDFFTKKKRVTQFL